MNKNIKTIFTSASLIVFTLVLGVSTNASQDLTEKLKGRILLQVEESGQAYYVEPETKQRAFLGRPADAFKIMKELGLGIRHAELTKYLNSQFPERLSGKILLDVEANGEAYYVFPDDLKGYYLGRPTDAFQIMRAKGLGITNKDLEKVPVFQKYQEQVNQNSDLILELQQKLTEQADKINNLENQVAKNIQNQNNNQSTSPIYTPPAPTPEPEPIVEEEPKEIFLTLTQSNQEISKSAMTNASQILLASFNLSASGGDIKLTQLNLVIDRSNINNGGSSEGLNNAKIYIDGAQIGIIKTLNEGNSNSSSDQATIFILNNPIIIPENQIRVLNI